MKAKSEVAWENKADLSRRMVAIGIVCQSSDPDKYQKSQLHPYVIA